MRVIIIGQKEADKPVHGAMKHMADEFFATTQSVRDWLRGKYADSKRAQAVVAYTKEHYECVEIE